MQKEFEALAKAIMDKTKRDMDRYASFPTYRMEALQQMKKELLELKSCYEGLIDAPLTGTFKECFQLN